MINSASIISSSAGASNKIPKPTKLENVDKKLLEIVKNDISKLTLLMNKQDLNEYIKLVVNYSFQANKYFNDLEPWTLKKENPERMNNILFTICEQIKNISILLNSVIPISTGKVLEIMNLKNKKISLDMITNLNCFDHDIELGELSILFKKIENDN